MYTLIFAIVAALFWLIAELVSLRIQNLKHADKEQQKANFEAVSAYFNQLFLDIQNSTLSKLPLIGMRSLIDLKDKVFAKIENTFKKINAGINGDKEIGCFSSILLILLATSLFALVLLLVKSASTYPDCVPAVFDFSFCYPNGYGYTYAKFTFLAIVVPACPVLFFFMAESNIIERILVSAGILLVMVAPIAFALGFGVLLLDFSLSLGVWYSILPLLGLSILGPYALLQIVAFAGSGFVAPTEADTKETAYEKARTNAEAQKRFPKILAQITPGFPFLLGFFLSFVVSSLAMIFGQLLAPIAEAKIPLTVPMLIFNALADGLTLTITIFILNRLLDHKDPSFFRVVYYIFMDILIAGILAVVAILLGSLFEDVQYVGFVDAVELLLAYSFEDTEFRISSGPYFFLIHTTFIPTLLYVSIILIFYLIKSLIYRPMVFLSKQAKNNEAPLTLLVGAIKVIARIFALIVAIMILAKSDYFS